MEALKEEIEQLEQEDKTFAEEVGELKEEELKEEEVIEEPQEEAPQEEAPTTEELEKKQKQDAYRERQRVKQEEKQKAPQQYDDVAAQAVQEPVEQDELNVLKAQMAQMGAVIQKQQFDDSIKAAERELNGLETDFKEAFTDYDNVVTEALEFTKMNLVAKGMADSDVDDYLRREKVMIADKAAAAGKDPVEAVYKEAKDIMGVFDAYAEKKGYTRGKPKTNLQAIREISKPNAMTGGSGSAAIKKGYEDLDSEEVGELTMQQMLNGATNAV